MYPSKSTTWCYVKIRLNMSIIKVCWQRAYCLQYWDPIEKSHCLLPWEPVQCYLPCQPTQIHHHWATLLTRVVTLYLKACGMNFWCVSTDLSLSWQYDPFLTSCFPSFSVFICPHQTPEGGTRVTLIFQTLVSAQDSSAKLTPRRVSEWPQVQKRMCL